VPGAWVLYSVSAVAGSLDTAGWARAKPQAHKAAKMQVTVPARGPCRRRGSRRRFSARVRGVAAEGTEFPFVDTDIGPAGRRATPTETRAVAKRGRSSENRRACGKVRTRFVRRCAGRTTQQAGDDGVKAVCVFCGSNSGALPEYRAAAEMLAREIVADGCTLVYGGGKVGLMGVIGDAAMAAGGRVIGVTPRRLVEKEVAHTGLTELRVVDSMHERKAMMAELSDAFIALPGGIGTFEEFFEVLTWSQLGFHAKPCGLLNVAGYYDQLLGFLDHSVTQGFLRKEHRSMVLTDTEPARLLDQLETFRMPVVNKWLDKASI